MSVATNSGDVTAGNDALAAEYNNLRQDVLAVEENSPPVGTLIDWAGAIASPPTNYLVCDGSAVSRAVYSGLYAVVGDAFGNGDGTTTFNLPDFRNKYSVGAGSSFTVGQEAGSNTVDTRHTHTGGLHSHNVNPHTHVIPSHNHSIPSHRHSKGTLRALINITDDGRIYQVWDEDNIIVTFARTGYVGYEKFNVGVGRTTMIEGVSGAWGGNTGSWGDNTGSSSSGTSSDGAVTTSQGGNQNQDNKPASVAVVKLIKYQ